MGRVKDMGMTQLDRLFESIASGKISRRDARQIVERRMDFSDAHDWLDAAEAEYNNRKRAGNVTT